MTNTPPNQPAVDPLDQFANWQPPQGAPNPASSLPKAPYDVPPIDELKKMCQGSSQGDAQ